MGLLLKFEKTLKDKATFLSEARQKVIEESIMNKKLRLLTSQKQTPNSLIGLQSTR